MLDLFRLIFIWFENISKVRSKDKKICTATLYVIYYLFILKRGAVIRNPTIDVTYSMWPDLLLNILFTEL